MKERLKEWLPYVIIVLVVVLLRVFIITPVTVDGPSMQETLFTNDIVLLNKLNKNNLKRNDIVVVQHGKNRLIKRLLAFPGEKIKCVSGIIYVNEEELEKDYGYGKTENFQEVKLGEDEYFVVGDNRQDSYDSRAFGPVKKSEIQGTVNLVIFPFNRIKSM